MGETIALSEDITLPSSNSPAIEVTPEMIEAGVLKLFDYDPRFSNENDVVTEMFCAMFAAHRAVRR